MDPFYEKKKGYLKADFHCHSAGDPQDKILHTEKDLIDTAAQKGYEVLSITNHDAVTFSPDLETYAKGKGILLIPGVELTVEGKHILMLNYRNGANSIRKLDDLASVGEETAVIAAHAYYPGRQSLKSKLAAYRRLFHAAEYCHLHFMGLNPNRRLVTDARRWDLPLVGTSDAHHLFQLGTTYSLVKSEKNISAVIEAIKKGEVEVITRPLTPGETFRTMTSVVAYYAFKRLFRQLKKTWGGKDRGEL